MTSRVFFLCSVLLSGCVSTPQTDQLLAGQAEDSSRHASHHIEGVPFFPQNDYHCGPAALATVLSASGLASVVPDDLVSKVYVPDRKGSFQVEMLAAARSYGRIPYIIEPRIEHLIGEVQADNPVLVLQNLGVSWYEVWHYAVVVGYDLSSEKLVMHSGEKKRRMTKLGVFEQTWRRSDYWGVVLLKPGMLPRQVDEQKYFLSVVDFARNNPAVDVVKAYQAGLGRWPDSKIFGFALANLYYDMGKLPEALAGYRRFLTVAPDFAPAYNNLAQLLSELGEHAEAIVMAEQAVALGGPHASLYQKTLDALRE